MHFFANLGYQIFIILFFVSCLVANILIIVIRYDGVIYLEPDGSATPEDQQKSIVGDYKVYFSIKVMFFTMRLIAIIFFLAATVQFVIVRHKASK